MLTARWIGELPLQFILTITPNFKDTVDYFVTCIVDDEEVYQYVAAKAIKKALPMKASHSLRGIGYSIPY